jgi:DNA-binding MarR family transcriptional regulator
MLVSRCNRLYCKRLLTCNNIFKMNHDKAERGRESAFLLAQLGAHAAAQFAERLRVLDLTPADAGILRLLRVAAGISQQELATKLRIHPSRLVAILDNLEKRSFVERRANPEDRRLYSLHLSKAGAESLDAIRKVAREHQEALLGSLSSEERATLAGLLSRVADQQGLTPGIHPGYQAGNQAANQGLGEGNRGSSDSAKKTSPAIRSATCKERQ